MKKLFVLMFLAILLVGTVSAMDWDNVKDYDEDTKTITITNALGLGDTIANIKLDTELSERVGVSPIEKIKVFEMTFEVFDDYNDAIQSIEFYNVKDEMNPIEIDLDYKYKVIKIEEGTNKVCNIDNKTLKEICNDIPYEREITTYEDYTGKDILKGNITISGWTTTKEGDKIEWIPTYFGEKINEWATWDAGLTNGLIGYWNLNDSSSPAVNSVDVSVYNSTTNTNITYGNAGIIENGFDFNGVDSVLNFADLDLPADFTLSFWFNMSSYSGDTALWTYIYNATNYMRLWANGGTDWRFTHNHNSASVNVLTGGTITSGLWNHIVIQSEDLGSGNINLTIWRNGTIWAGGTSKAGGNYSSGGINRFGNDLFTSPTMKLDEIGRWDRYLTPAEITQLYNSGTGITYNPILEASLDSPIDYYNSSLNEIEFSCSAITSYGTNLVNISRYDNSTGVWLLNQTNNVTGTSNSTTFNSTLIDGREVLWTCSACDSTGNCTFATENRTVTRPYIYEYSRTFNTSSHETAQETFSINVSANASLTNAYLVYNGTTYLTTKSGTTYSKTIQIPTSTGNKSFYWDFTYAGSNITTNSTNQTINETIFAFCNATYPTNFLNITFKDEADSSVINASITTSTFVYYLGDGTVNKTLTFINNSNNYNYTFCATPNKTLHVDPYVQYKQGTDYPQRIWDLGIIDYTNIITNQILYLLGSADGLYVTLQIINSADQLLSGVEGTVNRTIDGSSVTVGQGTTGTDGTLTFFLNPDFEHTFTFVKSGYTTYTTSFIPTQTSYTITLGGGVSVAGYDYSRGISYSINPKNGELTNDTTYNFNYTLSSTFWDVSEFGFFLKSKNGTILDSTSSSTNGGFLDLDLNTGNYTRIIMDYYFVINSTYINQTTYWNVLNSANTQWSIKTFFTDLDSYLTVGFFGIDDFGRYMVIFLILFLSVGIMSYKYGLTSPLAISSMVFAIIFFFDVVIELLPTPINAIPHSLTFMALLILITLILKEAQR